MKPSPWKCGTCRERGLVQATIDYRCEVCHDGRPYSLFIPGLDVLRCSRCGAIVLQDHANKMVTATLRKAAGLLTPEQIRRGRETLGMTQKQLAQALQVGESTLSRWETGGQLQQRSLDRLMRLYFHVPEARRYLDQPAGSVPAE